MVKFIIFLTRPIRYFWDFITYPKSVQVAKFKDLEGVFRGEPLLVVGNGPSLNKTPLDEFEGFASIGMNKIDLIYNRTSWRPSFVVCMNNLVVKQNWRAFIENGVPVFLAWKCRHFMPRRLRERFGFFLLKSGNQFSLDPAQGLGSSATVTYAALQIAYHTGANPVVLVGVDHSFKSEGKPHEIKKMKEEDQNHFDPNYFRKGQLWGIPNLEQSEFEYQLARDAFERDGREVLDATVGGKLDIFRKVSIDEAISIFKK